EAVAARLGTVGKFDQRGDGLGGRLRGDWTEGGRPGGGRLGGSRRGGRPVRDVDLDGDLEPLPGEEPAQPAAADLVRGDDPGVRPSCSTASARRAASATNPSARAVSTTSRSPPSPACSDSSSDCSSRGSSVSTGSEPSLTYCAAIAGPSAPRAASASRSGSVP